MPKHKLVRKILRSLPERFKAKMITIEASKDIDKMKLDEPFESLRTYEMNFPPSKRGKKNGL